jgi:hypothetical protein
MTFIDPLPHLIDMTDYALVSEIAATYPEPTARDRQFPAVVASGMIAAVSKMLPRCAPHEFRQHVAKLFRLVEADPTTWRLRLDNHRIGGELAGGYAALMARLMPSIVEAVARRRMAEAIELVGKTVADCQAEDERRRPKPPKPRHFTAKFAGGQL